MIQICTTYKEKWNNRNPCGKRCSTDTNCKMAQILGLPDKDKNVYDKGVLTGNH